MDFQKIAKIAIKIIFWLWLIFKIWDINATDYNWSSIREYPNIPGFTYRTSFFQYPFDICWDYWAYNQYAVVTFCLSQSWVTTTELTQWIEFEVNNLSNNQALWWFYYNNGYWRTQIKFRINPDWSYWLYLDITDINSIQIIWTWSFIQWSWTWAQTWIYPNRYLLIQQWTFNKNQSNSNEFLWWLRFYLYNVSNDTSVFVERSYISNENPNWLLLSNWAGSCSFPWWSTGLCRPWQFAIIEQPNNMGAWVIHWFSLIKNSFSDMWSNRNFLKDIFIWSWSTFPEWFNSSGFSGASVIPPINPPGDITEWWFDDCTSFLDVGCYISNSVSNIFTFFQWFFPSITWTSSFNSCDFSTSTGATWVFDRFNGVIKLLNPIPPLEWENICFLWYWWIWSGAMSYQRIFPDENWFAHYVPNAVPEYVRDMDWKVAWQSILDIFMIIMFSWVIFHRKYA